MDYFHLHLHPNTRTGYKLVLMTLFITAAIVLVLQLLTPAAEIDRIAFASHDGNDFEIFTVNPDGSDLTQLTDNDHDDWGATWSPDRQHLAFRSNPEGASGVFRMSVDGQNIERLTPPRLYAGDPYHQGTMTWSPDGSQIAFSGTMGGNWDIWIVRSDQTHLTRFTTHAGDDLHPDWSPDGTQIAFTRYDDGLLTINVMNVNDNTTQPLTGSFDGMALYPRWSPDGNSIVYFVNNGSDADLYFLDLTSGVSRQLTTHIAIDRVGVFSPDGSALVFRSERDGDSDIYTMNLANGAIKPVSMNNAMDMSPDW